MAHCEQEVAGKTSWDHYPQSPPSPALGSAPQFSKHFYTEGSRVHREGLQGKN